MSNRFLVSIASVVFLTSGVHHSFSGEFDQSKPITLEAW